MKIKIHNWQHKANNLESALIRMGVQITKREPDILLVDFDAGVSYYTELIEKTFAGGSEIVLYSHGAPVITAWDMVWEPDKRIAVFLAQSEGEKEVMQAYDYPNPIEVIGWHYCKQKKFKPVKEIKKVLFAPWHPHSNGYLMPACREANRNAYEKLRAMPYNLTVMHIGNVRNNGISIDPDVTYIGSEKSIPFSLKHIDQADVVISNLMTVACIAIARGKPVVVFGQNIKPHDGYSDENLSYVKNWEKYRDLMRYPYDLSNLKPRASQYMIEHAALHEAEEWREKFIGDPLDVEKLMTVLERVLSKDEENE